MNRKRILITDDDREIIDGASIRLRAAGYSTAAARDGEEAMSLATTDPPDAMVLDVKMPRVDGLTTLKMLRRRDDTKDIPVVMLSASIVDRKAALDAGACRFIKKPYHGRDLVNAVEAAIEVRENEMGD